MTVPTASPHSGAGRRIVAGIGALGVTQAMLVLGQLVSVPVFLSAWGAGTYADWLVLSAAAGLLALADLGVVGYLGNSLRAAWARGDEAAGRRILQSGLGVYVALTGVTTIALVTVLAAVDAPALLGVSRLDDAGPTLLLLCLTTVMQMPHGLVTHVHAARGQFHREVFGLALVQNSFTAAGLLTALAGGTPLHAAAAQILAVAAAGWGVRLRELRRHYGDVPLRPLRPTGAELRVLAAKAPLYAVQQCSVNVLANAPVLLLGSLVTPAMVVTFTTMRTFTGIVRQTARQIALPLGLEMARMHACADHASAGRLYAESALPLGCVVALLAGAAWAVGPAVFELWTHGTTSFDPLTGALFLAGALLQVPAYGAAGLLRLVDRPGVVALVHVAEIAAMMALGLVLIPRGGAAGAALAIVLAETVASTPWHIRAAGRLLDRPMLWPAVRTYLVAAAAFSLAVLVAVGVERVASLRTPAGLAAFTALWGVAAAAVLFAALTAGQRAWIAERLRRSLARLRGDSWSESSQEDRPPLLERSNARSLD